MTLLSKYGAFKLGSHCLFPPCYLDSKFGKWYMNSSSCSPLLVWAPTADFFVFDPSSWSFGLSQGGLELRSDVGYVLVSISYREYTLFLCSCNSPWIGIGGNGKDVQLRRGGVRFLQQVHKETWYTKKMADGENATMAKRDV